MGTLGSFAGTEECYWSTRGCRVGTKEYYRSTGETVLAE